VGAAEANSEVDPSRGRLRALVADLDRPSPVFTRQVRDALIHLHDLPYLQTHPLTRFLQHEKIVGGKALQRGLLEALTTLAPRAGDHIYEGKHRIHRLLTLRYVQAQEAAEVWNQLGIGKSEYYREHGRGLQAVASLLAREWSMPDRSERSFTPDQQRILEAGAPAGADPGTPLRPRHNLPAQLTSFVGREFEIRAVQDLLRKPDSRLVTLTGSGGTGKTRLAIRVAEDLLDEFPDGIFFVGLGTVAGVGAVARAVAQALGVLDLTDHSPEDGISEYLRPQRVVLIIDNFEHLLPEAPTVIRILTACPEVKVLVTSRARLRVSGEQEYPVTPLPIPDLRRLPPAALLARYPAVTLFVERAGRTRPDFRLTSDNARAIAAICVRLDGLPLAIELAAAWVKLLPPDALLSELVDPDGSPLRLLTGGAQDLAPRQQTLRSTIAWSYNLLTRNEQQLFRRLSVFVGSFTLEAAEAIWRPGLLKDGGFAKLPEPEADLIDGLASLVDKSLVSPLAIPDTGPRFVMLETIRDFASEELAATGDQKQIQATHARFFLDIVEASGAFLLGSARDRLQRTLDEGNIRAALLWLVTHG
jgi:predicted ATPase